MFNTKFYSPCYRIYLHLQYNEHVEAKSYGCLWDSRRNKWYFHNDEYVKSGIKNDIDLHNKLRPHMILDNKIQYLHL